MAHPNWCVVVEAHSDEDCHRERKAYANGPAGGAVIPRLTKEQAAIIGAFTGIACGPFRDIQEYAEKKFGRPIWTHEFADRELAEELKELAREDFLDICNRP